MDDEDRRFDHTAYNLARDEDFKAFIALVKELKDSLKHNADDEGAWSENKINSFVAMIFGDQDLFEIAANRICVLREPSVSYIHAGSLIRVGLTRHRAKRVQLITTSLLVTCLTRFAAFAVSESVSASIPAMPNERLRITRTKCT
jgi:hypothetical protein